MWSHQWGHGSHTAAGGALPPCLPQGVYYSFSRRQQCRVISPLNGITTSYNSVHTRSPNNSRGVEPAQTGATLQQYVTGRNVTEWCSGPRGESHPLLIGRWHSRLFLSVRRLQVPVRRCSVLATPLLCRFDFDYWVLCCVLFGQGYRCIYRVLQFTSGDFPFPR